MRKIKQLLGKLSYRQKLLYSQIGITVLIIFLMSLIMMAVLSDKIRENEEMHLEKLLQVVNENISSQIEVFDTVSFDLLVNDSLKECMNQTDSIKYGRAFNTIRDILGAKTIGTIGLSSIAVIDIEGHVYSSDIGLLLPENYDLEKTEVFCRADEHPGELVWLTENDIYNSYGTVGLYKNKTDIHAAAVIRDYIRKQVYGILILSLNQDFFQKMTFSDKELKNINMYLVSEDKSKNYGVSGTRTNLEESVLESLDFTNKTIDVKASKNKFVSYLYNTTMGWYLVSVTDARITQEWFYQIAPILLTVLMIGILLFSLISNRFFKSMTKEIDSLIAGMEKVERGNFGVVVASKRSDEIGVLVNEFNHMVRQINELIILKYQQELLTQKAEFQVLQAQINPHFLYNTLDMLNWQLVIRGENDLSDSVIAIGNLLRYSMSRDHKNVFLEDELQNIRDYLSVQYSISGKEIEYNIDVQDSQKIWLPRLSMQPLVENAITHGFEGRDKNNSLKITGRRCTEDGVDSYILIIEDNGIGMQEEELRRLSELHDPENSLHLGVANVRKRISYLYRGKGELIFESRYGYGTKVIIKLPLQSLRREENEYETGNRG